ncbi:MAG: molybdopterin molybdotransferase MoeA [Gammaproteobacteria bacterium]
MIESKDPIAREPSCADGHDADAMPVAEALARISTEISPPAGQERLGLRLALQRVLAEDIAAPEDVPAHANAAMDGYALAGGDLPSAGSATLRVIGTALAGRPFAGTLRPGDCLRIMTGAPVPAGADTVIMQEHVERAGDTIRLGPGHRLGQNVRPAGEDLARGAVVVQRGRRITPADLGLIASLGRAEVSLFRRPRVAYFSTGDELRSIGDPLEAGCIYDSNRYTLYGMLHRLGVEAVDLGVVRDTQDQVLQVLGGAGGWADAIISSGGVSVGEADFITEALRSQGRLALWKVAMKPGRPIAFGRIGQSVFFGLPGNPVSVMATFYTLVQPALRQMMGEQAPTPLVVKARCTTRLKKKPGRVEYQRGVLGRDEHGDLTVRATGPQGSAILRSMHEADCFIVLPSEWGRVEPGTLVTVQPFFGLV